MTARSNPRVAALTRRRLLASGAAVGAGLAGLALAGCGDDDDGRATPAAPAEEVTPQRGGVLRAVGGPVGSILDVQRARATLELLPWQWTGNSLVRFSAATPYAVEPDLAARAPELTPDGLLVAFAIRPDAKWQNRPPANGRAVSARDVKATFDRMKALGQLAPRSGNYSNIDSVTVLDDLTVQFKLKAPQADFLNILADQSEAILPQEVTAKGTDAIAQLADVVGSGPYELTAFEAGRRVQVRRRADGYWKPNTAWLEGWDMINSTDDGQKANTLFAGLADVAEVTPSIGRIFDADPGFAVLRAISPARDCVLINHATGPWKDPRVRLAFARAMNRTQVYPSVFEGAGVAAGAVTPAAVTWALPEAELKKLPGFGPRDTELAEAKKLLVAAGFANGFDDKLVVVNAARLPDVARVIADNLAEAGIRLTTDPVGDFSVATDRARRGEFSLALTQFLAGIYPDAQLYLYHHSKNGAANYGKYASAELDAKLDKQRTVVNTAERVALVNDIERYIAANPGPIWIGSRVQATAVSKKVRNYVAAPFSTGYDAAENTWLRQA